MIQVQVSTLTQRKKIVVPKETSIKSALDEANVELRDGISISLNGHRVGVEELDNSFEDTGVELEGTVFLTAVVNSKNA